MEQDELNPNQQEQQPQQQAHVLEMPKPLSEPAAEDVKTPPPSEPPQVQAQQMPESITIPFKQFIEIQQQLNALKQIKPIPKEAMTEEMCKKACTAQFGGHNIMAFHTQQTQPTENDPARVVVQTLICCSKCGAALAQIRGQG